MISPIAIATRGYIGKTPLSIGTRGYITNLVGGITIYGEGVLNSIGTSLYGFGWISLPNIEIRRAFKVGISLTRTFMTNIAAKIKIKVNK